MNFFVSEEALGGAGRSRREMRAEIAALCDKLDVEREKRDELLAALPIAKMGSSTRKPKKPCGSTEKKAPRARTACRWIKRG